MAHPSEELVRRGFDAFSKGDVETLRELFDQDAVWHTPGRGPFAGDHRGVDAILGFFARTMELTGGTFRVELHDVLANDEHAVSLYVARGEREGRTLEDKSVLARACPRRRRRPGRGRADQHSPELELLAGVQAAGMAQQPAVMSRSWPGPAPA